MSGPHPDQFGSQFVKMSSRQNSGIDPTYQSMPPPQPSPFNPFAMPSPNPITSDVTISYSQQYTQSPAQMPNATARSPYPQHRPIQRPQYEQNQPSRRTSGATEDIERATNPQPSFNQFDYQEYLELKREKEEMKREKEERILREQAMHRQWDQIQSQPKLQSSPYMSHQGGAGPVLRRHPGHMQPVYQNDFDFGYPFEDLGQSHGLPGRGPPNTVAAPNGHHYGPVAITGTARIIRGNVVDTGRPFLKAKNHSYGGQMIVQGDATVWDGDQTIETANTFWEQGRIGQTDRLNER